MIKLRERRRRKTSPPREQRLPGKFQRFLGWCVHGYTASGLVAAAMIAVLLVRGGADAFRWSFLLMAIATIVDATDGTFARMIQIKKVVPSFDGRRLDDIVDFLTYTFLPLLLIYRAKILPEGQESWLLLPLIASVYGFCQVQAKTDDGYFLGFPSLWNIVALYVYVLPFGPWGSLALVIALAILTFVPTRHLYPSQPGKFNQLATILGIIWAPMIAWVIWTLPTNSQTRFSESTVLVAYLSLAYPVFYLGASWAISVIHWQKRARAV
jgi:phosphatidylcholine synthase